MRFAPVRRAAVIVMATGLLAGSTSSSPAAPERVARPAGTTIISGPTGSAPLAIEERAVVTGKNVMTRRSGPNGSVTFTNTGAFTGVLILPEDYVGAPQEGRWLLAGQFDLCQGGVCAKWPVANVLFPGGRRTVLLPGRYRVYFVGDGEGSSVRLQFENLPGRTSITTDDPSSGSVASPSAPASANEGVTSWAAGDEYRAGRTGVRLALLSFRAPQYRGGGIGICHYANAAPPPRQAAYGPHCNAATRATGAGTLILRESQDEDEDFLLVSGLTYHDEAINGENGNLTGTHGLGAWITSPGPVEDIRHVGVFFVTEE